MRAWRSFDRFEGRSVGAVVALSHREQRLLRHVEGPPAARAADGPHGGRPRRRPGRPAHRRRSRGSVRSPTAASCSAATIPAEAAGDARVGAARVRRRAAAPPGAPARGADPARGVEVEGDRGRGAARHDGRVGQQRAAAGARRRSPTATSRAGARRSRSTTRSRSCSRATSTRSSASTSSRSCAAARGRDDADAAVPAVDAGRERARHLAARPGSACRGIAARAPSTPTARPRSRSGASIPTAGSRRGAIHVLTISDGAITAMDFFVDPDLFPLFDLPVHLDAEPHATAARRRARRRRSGRRAPGTRAAARS